MSRLTIIRGLPGSGKSTFAERLAEKEHAIHIEADMFHMREGKYCFDRENVARAHGWCKHTTAIMLHSNHNVIVANTFITYDYLHQYLEMVPEFLRDLRIINCIGNFGSIHDVPEEAMNGMKMRWQLDVRSHLYLNFGIRMMIEKSTPEYEWMEAR